MNEDVDGEDVNDLPESSKATKVGRGVLQLVGGTIPFAGGLTSVVAGAWSEHEQDKVNRFFQHWIQMLQDELKEKEETIIEIMSRVDLQDEKVSQRVESPEYQSLLKKTFRDWAGAESDEKREYIRNILANAASCEVSSDDVVRMYIDWIRHYSVVHFDVIGAIYNSDGITRGEIWTKIGKGQVREDSADADLYKLLFRDLSTGSIIRQVKPRDHMGNVIPQRREKRPKNSGPKPPVSAFDESEGYELTELGKQFIHYAMNDLPMRIEFKPEAD